MSRPRFHLVSPPVVDDFLRGGAAGGALELVARLVGADFTVDGSADLDLGGQVSPAAILEKSIQYDGQIVGHLYYHAEEGGEPAELAGSSIKGFVEYMVERETAIGGLADEMISSYGELNMLYALLPNITARVREEDIGEALVEQTAQTLSCRRVSLLVIDEDRKNLRVMASRGLPPEARATVIPMSGTVAEKALSEDEVLVVNDISRYPELESRSRGTYASKSFAAVRVPLRARGERLGVLSATERLDGGEFTARDRKLLEGLSAMGTSALLNCRLHAAVNRQMIGTIHALASAVDAKDQYTHDHSSRVSRFCVDTARTIGVRDARPLQEIELAGLLHDIGKIGVPDAILSKPGRLSNEEFEIIKSHVHIGAGIVGKVKGLENVAQAVRHHHERHDGLGYPDGLASDAIPLASKLIAVGDTFDSLTSERSYHRGIDHDAALRELRKCSGTQFDPLVVEAFMAQMQPLMPVSCEV
jgi:putative nucleotidyltransferase with HDIG domain